MMKARALVKWLLRNEFGPSTMQMMKSSSYEITFDDDPQIFFQAVRLELEKNEAQNNLLLGIAIGQAKKNKTEALMARINEGDQCVAAAVRVDPHALVFYARELPAIDSLALSLAQNQKVFPGVVAEKSTATHFAEVWSRLHFSQAELAMEQGIYQLEQVHWPKNQNGKMRTATSKDIDLVSQWVHEFCQEVLPHEHRRYEQTRSFCENSIETFHFWEIAGEAKSLAAWARPTTSGIVINSVFTPKKHRGNGFATHLVAHLSQKCLDMGKKFCCLYTDMANPASNRLYQSIGYRLVGHSRHFLFS